MDTLEKVNKNKSEKRIFSKLGYDKKGTEELVSSMNLLIADFSMFYQKLRNFHWNVKGPDFFDLHEQFEELYEFSHTNIDNVAERIRVFGRTPMSNFSDYIANSEITESQGKVKSDEMVEIILNDMRIVLERMFNVLDMAIDAGDSGTEDMMKDYVQYIEKKHWMLSSFLGKE